MVYVLWLMLALPGAMCWLCLYNLKEKRPVLVCFLSALIIVGLVFFPFISPTWERFERRIHVLVPPWTSRQIEELIAYIVMFLSPFAIIFVSAFRIAHTRLRKRGVPDINTIKSLP